MVATKVTKSAPIGASIILSAAPVNVRSEKPDLGGATPVPVAAAVPLYPMTAVGDEGTVALEAETGRLTLLAAAVVVEGAVAAEVVL